MSIDSKTKNYQIHRKIALFFIFLHQPLILRPLQLKTFLIDIMMMKPFGLMVDCLIKWGWPLLVLLLITLL